MGNHRNPRPATALLAKLLEDTTPTRYDGPPRIAYLNWEYIVFATTPTRYDGPSRIAGVDSLTGVVLEQRVALEACRA